MNGLTLFRPARGARIETSPQSATLLNYDCFRPARGARIDTGVLTQLCADSGDFRPARGARIETSRASRQMLHSPFRPARGARIETCVSADGLGTVWPFAPLAGRGLKRAVV